MLGGQLRPRPNSDLATTHLKQGRDLFRENSFAFNPCSPARIAQSIAATNRANTRENFRFSLGKMLVEPALEERRHRKRQSHDGITRELRTGFCRSSQN